MLSRPKRRILITAATAAAVAGAAFVVAGAVRANAGPVVRADAPPAAGKDGIITAAYVKCLNDHGWPVGPGLRINPNGIAPAPEVINAAVNACEALENGALEKLRPSDKAYRALGYRSRRFATCMRLHGVEIGSPHLFRVRIGIGVGFPKVDPATPGFDDAYAACKSIMNVFG
jgi:hypothetical protein